MSLTLVNWNVEWATGRSQRFDPIRGIVAHREPHIVCMTEGEAAILPAGGSSISSDPDYGYGDRYPHRRKVLLWSRSPWEMVDKIGHPSLPTGRFVVGVTQTPLGNVRFAGVCIPWRDAHVLTGQRNRTAWEDHLDYLNALAELLPRYSDGIPTVVVGDYNQTIPRTYAPKVVYDRLVSTFNGWQIVTTGKLPGTVRPAIDHVAVDTSLELVHLEAWPGENNGGVRLSDHDGQRVTLRRIGPSGLAPHR